MVSLFIRSSTNPLPALQYRQTIPTTITLPSEDQAGRSPKTLENWQINSHSLFYQTAYFVERFLAQNISSSHVPRLPSLTSNLFEALIADAPVSNLEDGTSRWLWVRPEINPLSGRRFFVAQFISQAVEDRMPAIDMFDENGRFSPPEMRDGEKKDDDKRN